MKKRTPKPVRIQTYKSKQGWRWRMWHGSRIVACSGEGFTRLASCEKSWCRLIDAIASGCVIDVTGCKLAKG